MKVWLRVSGEGVVEGVGRGRGKVENEHKVLPSSRE